MFLCQTQTGMRAYMTRVRHHTKHEPAHYDYYVHTSVQGHLMTHDHVCTSLQHEIIHLI